MAGPPGTIEASALWAVLARAERPFKVVDFPREDADGKAIGQVAIRVLTQEEQMICSAAAEKFAREHLKDAKKDELGYEAIYSNAAAIEVLCRACRDVSDVSRPAFPSPKMLSQALTADETGVLFQHYLTTQLELGPIVAMMSDEEMEAWITRIGEGGSAFPLDLVSQDLLKTLLLSSAKQVVSLQMAKSSAGSPPAELIASPSMPDDLHSEGTG